MTAAHTISLFNSNADMTAALVNDACFALDAPGPPWAFIIGRQQPLRFLCGARASRAGLAKH